ncbi:uncharacterized protein [Penaeus vannamei]|uniref:uncharacterized protein n=1 Tax=Penaeus vannamei TaxID=6689 RepID=UPI00387F63CF
MPSQTRVRRGFTRRFTGTAPSLLAGAVLLAAAVARAACADTNFVRRFASGGRYFYVVKDFALRDPADYETVTMPSACQCRKRCQVDPTCQAVSAVPSVAGGGVECRTSTTPLQLGDWSQRPDLLKTPGAIHILETDITAWEEPEIDGMFYQYRDAFDYSYCRTGYERATAKSSVQFDIFKRKFDELRTILGLNCMWTGLRNVYTSGYFEPVWDSSTTAPPLEPRHFNDSGIPYELLTNRQISCYYIMITSGTGFEFLAKRGPYRCKSLCQANKLKLQWS